MSFSGSVRTTLICVAAATSTLAAQDSAATSTPPIPANPEFAAPVRLKADGDYVKVESPGYAAPCWADVDGDGRKDLIVGQFNKGKMKVYRNLGQGKLGAGKWLESDGEIAEVPGVW